MVVIYVKINHQSHQTILSKKVCLILFQKFIESYQNSHYITACKNWISILDLNLQSLPEKTKQGYVAGPETDDLLRSEIEKLREENKKLRHDLEQLQQALER